MAAAAEDKEALVAQVQELRSQLLPQMERDRALTRAEGRPWSDAQWLSGEPSQHKYPSGPAFLPLGRTSDVTPWTGIANMNVGEWVNVALGSAALYATGFSSAAALGVKNGHRMGFWTAVPAAIVGVAMGHRTGVFRFLGYTDNGNPTLYPGYKEDQTPYFVKHMVSDRHVAVAPRVALDDPTRFR